MNARRIVQLATVRNQRRALRRDRLFRDRLNPLDYYDDMEIRNLFRFQRCNLLRLIDQLTPLLEHPTNTNHALPVSLQVCLVL